MKTVFGEGQFRWYATATSDTGGLKRLASQFNIDQEILTYAQDPHERAHVEYDADTGTFLLIFNVAHREKIENHYDASPMTFIVKDHELFTINDEHTSYVNDLIAGFVKAHPEVTPIELLFNALFLVSDAFFPLVQDVDAERRHYTSSLRERTTKSKLLELSDLGIGLIYLVAAAKQNAVVIRQIKVQQPYHRLSDSAREQLDDAEIEANQLVEMTEMSSQIIGQLSDTYNNVLNNNLNDIMRFMTVWSLLLAIPTIVTGFFGMNVALPLENAPHAWLIVTGIAAVLWLAMGLMLRHSMRK